jgi:hypothetical protein
LLEEARNRLDEEVGRVLSGGDVRVAMARKVERGSSGMKATVPLGATAS